MVRNHTRQQFAGFTFVEVMMVLIILSIIAAMALPMFGDSDQTRLRGAARLLAGDLGFVQSECLAHTDDPRLIVFENDGYYIAAASDPSQPIVNPTSRQPYRTRFGQSRAHTLAGVRIDSTNVGDDGQLAFGSYGQLDQGADAVIVLAANDATLTVTIDAETGDVTIGN